MADPTVLELMQQANQCMQSKQFEQAKRTFLEVIRRNPDASEAHYFLGWIAHNEKQPVLAAENLERACNLAPGNKNYASGLISIYGQLKQFGKAISACQRFLESNSGDAEIQFHLATALANNRDLNAAIEAYEKGIVMQPDQLPFYMGLGNLYYHTMRFQDAQATFLKAYEQGLKSEGLYLNIAKLYMDHGDKLAAMEVLRRGLADFPDNLVFPYRLVSLDPLSLTSELENQLRAKDVESVQGQDAFYLKWLLAQIARKTDQDIALEMQLLIAAHNDYVAANSFPRNKDFYLNALPTMKLLTGNLPTSRETVLSASVAPVFIIGVPRCGSTLVENIICSGPDRVAKGEECSVILDALIIAHQTGSVDFWQQFASTTEQKYQKLGLLSEEPSNEAIFTDKSLENIFLVEFILGLFPKAKIIYCQRNPIASAVSILRSNLEVLPWAHSLEDITQYFDLCFKAAAKWQKVFPENVYTLTYENLVSEPIEQSKQLMAFCDRQWDESCLKFYEKKDVVSRTASHAQVRQGIHTDSVHAYQDYATFFEDYKSQYVWL